MKKNELIKKLALGAALTGAALQMGGCFHHQTLYGPPPEEPETEITLVDYDPENEPIEALYGPPPETFSEEETVEVLYGPPPEAETVAE
ncbi:MAG: hypothetical protein IJK40_09840 [Clostridia bacterium]|nr:hypothetical protein [Clostridia bacterium]